jgi:ABC-type multidrug transport system ATPase subunit
MLSLIDLQWGHGQGPVLDALNAELSPGLTWITGDEGSGKTTLLKVVAGRVPPSRGDIVLDGVCLATQGDDYRRQVFWTDPRSEFHEQLIAGHYFEQLAPSYPSLNTGLLEDLIKALALSAHLHKQVHMLSTGSKRKLWLAAAFSCGAPLTLIDEPFAALDRPSALVIRELLEDCVQHPERHWMVADYGLPIGLATDHQIELSRPHVSP